MLASTVVITVLVAGAVAAWTLTRGDGGSSAGPGGEWDEIALVDRTAGAVTTVDSEGETTTTAIGLGRVTDVLAHGDHLALVGGEQIVLHTPGEEAIVVPIDRDTVVTRLVTPDTFHLAVGRTSGGNVLIVDAATGSILDVGALAQQPDPLLFVETLRWSPEGTAFAVADAANFQTIVVRPEVDEATFLQDQPVAVGDELIATSQTVGRQADVALFDFERREQANVPTEIPAGGMMLDDTLLMVSIDGEISMIERGAQEARSLGSTAVPSGATVRSVHPTAAGERIVVIGNVFVAVVDLDGNTVFNTTFTTPVDVVPPEPEWSCLPVGGDGTYHSVVSLDSGEQLADLTGIDVIGVAGDGCSVLGERNGIIELVTADGIVRLGQVRAAWLAPDGRSVVRTTTTGRTELIRIDDDLAIGDPVVFDDAPSNLEVAFLDH